MARWRRRLSRQSLVVPCMTNADNPNWHSDRHPARSSWSVEIVRTSLVQIVAEYHLTKHSLQPTSPLPSKPPMSRNQYFMVYVITPLSTLPTMKVPSCPPPTLRPPTIKGLPSCIRPDASVPQNRNPPTEKPNSLSYIIIAST